MPAIYHEGSWLGNATDPEVLVKDTVGWTGKNLLPYPYYEKSKTANGITFTVNNDGSVTVNGTATAGIAFNFTSIGNTGIKLNGDYIISGNPAFSASGMKFTVEAPAGRNNNVEGASDVKYTFNNTEVYNIRLWIYSGTTIDNVTIYPMLRRADIIDPTYEPYHESVEEEIEQIYADNGVLGAKNFCYPAENTKTVNGITFTVNSDNTLTISTVAGGATGQGVFRYDGVPKNTILKLNGCTAGGAASKYELNVVLSTGSFTKYAVDYGEGSDAFNVGNNDCMVNIVIRSGQVITTPITFKPMLRLASDPDDTYQPYAMTNKELTEKRFEKRVLSSGDDLNNVKTTGVYGITTSPTNSPENQTYGTLIVQATSTGDIRQMFWRVGGGNGLLYIRSFGGNPGSWTSWYKFTGTVVS